MSVRDSGYWYLGTSRLNDMPMGRERAAPFISNFKLISPGLLLRSNIDNDSSRLTLFIRVLVLRISTCYLPLYVVPCIFATGRYGYLCLYPIIVSVL